MVKGVLRVSLSELNLALTLPTGQAFRWRKRKQGDVWCGVVDGYVFNLQQDAENGAIHWTVLNDGATIGDAKRRKLDTEEIQQILVDYFQVDHNLSKLYRQWSERDDNFAKIAPKFPGVRVLRQDPCENLFSFICSSNNNIQRISQMVENLCKNFGQPLYVDEEFGEMCTFPTVNQLWCDALEEALRSLKFGYRAKFIAQSAATLAAKCDGHPDVWFKQLRSSSYEEAREELMSLPGVGGKVADCVCLMSLDKCSAIPVDTHVWKIASQRYLVHLKATKSLTEKGYKEIGNFFRDRFGSHAGWAHSVLFCADLRQFKT